MDDISTINDLKHKIEKFVNAREWAQFHSPKNLTMAITIEASELMDIFKWYSSEDCKNIMENDDIKSAATEEIADIIIYAIAFANRNDIDISDAILNKLEKNNIKYPTSKYKGKF